MGHDDVDQRTRRWQRLGRIATDVSDTDPLQALRVAIREVRARPRDSEARRRLRAVAAEQGMWEQLAPLLADEARAARDQPQVAAAFYEELADVHENLDQPLATIAAMEAIVAIEPAAIDRHDRLAWLYRRAGAWAKAAAAYETVAGLGNDDRAHIALRAAARLYRDHGRAEQAASTYRAIVARRPTDLDAWRALDELYGELHRWRELADVRGELVARADSGVDKAALLRAQARALEAIGDAAGAAELVARAAGHAPEDLSGLVDYVSVLARAGKGREAANLLGERIAEATGRGADAEAIAALRSRLAGILEDACGDRPAAAQVLEELLAATPHHLPALERLVWHAAHDPDPRVHASALLRHATALPGHADKVVALTLAARRFRDAHDHHAAIRAFETALELAPDDAGLAAELEAARTTVVIERARIATGASAEDARGAEQRLRAILARQPHNLDASLALAEVLVATRRLDAAAEHLRDTLETAPDGTPDARLAIVVHRYALVMTALGDVDEAHNLLHEAHRLHRHDLVITLALGESCFTRKLWREASLHLGALADHADALAHAPVVASGLVHAALAEIRGLRPANAPRHLDAALRLDPSCAPALHALAEQAIERGETIRAAELLEREATVTAEPEKRLRLFDALGDLALDVLEDPARAERCWMQATAGGLAAHHVPVLDKLLAVQRARDPDSERGGTCERLASLVDEPRRRALAIEAADAFAAGGDLARAREIAEQLVAAYALDEAAIACASAIALALGDAELAKTWLRRALTAWDAAGERGAGDPRRADLWRRLGDTERARGNERAALAAYQRAVATAPDSSGALGARRGLVELATKSGEGRHLARGARPGRARSRRGTRVGARPCQTRAGQARRRRRRARRVRARHRARRGAGQ